MAEELTVSEFNDRVNSVVVNSGQLRDVSVVGEISGAKRSTAGHIYFDLKDGNSLIHCTLFRFAASRIRIEIKDGMKVVAFGSASYYAKGGSFGFNIESLTPYGKGESQKKLEELTAKLLKEGIFEPERKRAPPKYPNTIGVVTSPTGAVIKDIIDTTARRYPVNILLAPAIVQGEDAPITIVSGINSEIVVRAVVGSAAPVISAVGHATDKSLTDLAADRYAETPTAAAMIATPDRIDEMRNINNLAIRANKSLMMMVSSMRSRFESIDKRLSPKNARALLTQNRSDLKNLCLRMDAGLRGKINTERSRFNILDSKLDPTRLKDRLNQNMMYMDNLSERIDRSVSDILKDRKNRLVSSESMLNGLDPNKVLDRGYSMIMDAKGNVITSIGRISVDDDVTIRMRDGKAIASIKEVE